MTRKNKPAKPAGLPGLRAGRTPLIPNPAPNTAPNSGVPNPALSKHGRTPAHLPGEPGKGGFTRRVKPVPLPGKSRGR